MPHEGAVGSLHPREAESHVRAVRGKSRSGKVSSAHGGSGEDSTTAGAVTGKACGSRESEVVEVTSGLTCG